MKLRLIVLLSLAVFLAEACNKPDAQLTPSIRIHAQTTLNVPEEGGTQTVTLSASLSWTATCNADWISVSPQVGKGGDNQSVTLTVQPNYSTERKGSVVFVISGTTTSTELTVVQAASSVAQEDDPPVVQGDPVLSVDFTNGMGDFFVEDKDKGGFPGDLWSTHPKYGVVAQAYVSATQKRYKTESWLLSPRINLKGHAQLYLRFEHALNYTNDEKDFSKFIGVKVSADKGETWENVSIPNMTSGKSFEFQSSGDIDLQKYKDKVIQLAFTYKSTAETTPTWEIRKLLITENEEVITKDDLGDEYKGVPKWMELPKVADEKNFHIHTAPIGETNYRNYSFAYDPDNLVASWVAYPLCDLYTKNTVKRSDSWVQDPFVSTQANVLAGGSYAFSSNGYDRGHQIASADRLASSVMNQQTFYWTNVTPQLSNFNQNIWEKLEEQVREWSKASDTLYVVTGCMVGENSRKLSDHDGRQVAVPDAYFKALLRLSKGEYLGAGFYLEHKNYSDKKFENYSCSLKELEEKTGLSFFANLPAETAAGVKAASPKDNAFWKRNVED